MVCNSSYLTEKEIVSLIVVKDLQGMEALNDQYGACILGLIYKIVAIEDLAEIVFQDTLIAIWDKIDSFSESSGHLLPWTMKLAHNSAINIMLPQNYKHAMSCINIERSMNDCTMEETEAFL